MSIVGSISVSLSTVLATLIGGWLVTTRVADYWDRVKKSRDSNLAAAENFQRLYGEFVAVWKIWNNLAAVERGGTDLPQNARWDCLVRATAAEGAIEALLAKIAAERTLSTHDIDVLGGLRQAFKVFRRAIVAGRPLPWMSSDAEPYIAMKRLAAATSVLLVTPPDTRNRPSAVEAAAAFEQITDNRHGTAWTASGLRVSLVS
ncbi:hypothetical protein [Nocardia jiangsuensis]|uniref:Uncharacterized protein n=1 Tax=Nocardia jiangsuensis TaxID=1691563 RepID=A0ABV8DQP8_9NOCA